MKIAGLHWRVKITIMAGRLQRSDIPCRSNIMSSMHLAQSVMFSLIYLPAVIPFLSGMLQRDITGRSIRFHSAIIHPMQSRGGAFDKDKDCEHRRSRTNNCVLGTPATYINHVHRQRRILRWIILKRSRSQWKNLSW